MKVLAFSWNYLIKIEFIKMRIQEPMTNSFDPRDETPV